MSDEERLVAEIPEELKRLVDADERSNKEIAEASLWREFGGDKKGALDRRIEEIEQRINMVERERNERERELEQLRSDLDALKTKRDNAADEKAEALSDARDALATLDDHQLTPDNPAVENYADKCDMTPEELIDEL